MSHGWEMSYQQHLSIVHKGMWYKIDKAPGIERAKVEVSPKVPAPQFKRIIYKRKVKP